MKDIKLDPGYRNQIKAISQALILSESQVRASIRRSFDGNTSADLAPLFRFFQKAKLGEAITVAAIGGSITEGASARSHENGGNNAPEYTEKLNGEKSWVTRMKEWFWQQFGEEKVTVINAGIGATPSFLGTFRLEEMVLKHNPDLVLVEFSVNDSSTFHNLLENEIFEAYESILRRLLERGCAVIPVFMTDRDNGSLHREHTRIAQHYRLPCISYYDAIRSDDELICDWFRISPDEVHPNNVGHALMAICLCNYLRHIFLSCDDASPVSQSPLPTPLYQDTFYRVRTLFAKDLLPLSSGGFQLVENLPRFQNKQWKGLLIAENQEGELTVTVPAGVKRFWVQYYHCVGSYETEFCGRTKVTNTSAVGWPRAFWDRIYTGKALAQDTVFHLKTRKRGQVVLIALLMSY